MASTADGSVQLGFGIELAFVLQAKPKQPSELESFGYKDNHVPELQAPQNQEATSEYLKAQFDAAISLLPGTQMDTAYSSLVPLLSTTVNSPLTLPEEDHPSIH